MIDDYCSFPRWWHSVISIVVPDEESVDDIAALAWAECEETDDAGASFIAFWNEADNGTQIKNKRGKVAYRIWNWLFSGEENRSMLIYINRKKEKIKKRRNSAVRQNKYGK